VENPDFFAIKTAGFLEIERTKTGCRIIHMTRIHEKGNGKICFLSGAGQILKNIKKKPGPKTPV